MYKHFTMKIVILWCMLLEEYDPVVKYIEDTDNYAGYTLRSLLLFKSDVTESYITKETLA